MAPFLQLCIARILFLLCCGIVISVTSSLGTNNNPVISTSTQVPLAEVKVDEQLYSRQIFVYGKSAQQFLSSSNVVIRGSHTPLIAEIVKNLALAGVGKLTLVSDPKEDSGVCQLCGTQTLAEYARSVNPLVMVDEVTSADANSLQSSTDDVRHALFIAFPSHLISAL